MENVRREKKCLKVMKHFFFTFGLIDKLVRGTARTKTATTCFNLQRVSSDKTRLPREVFTGWFDKLILCK